MNLEQHQSNDNNK